MIVAAGALHTPALLLRSGLRHHKIGRHLTLHPVVAGLGLFPQSMNTGLERGVSMGVVVRNPPIHDPLLSNYQVAIQTPPVHTGIAGFVAPWSGGLSLKLFALGWRNMATFVGITRDLSSASNRVVIDSDGRPVLHYRITPQDEKTCMAGLMANLRMMRASGAKVITSSCGAERIGYFTVDEYTKRGSDVRNEDERFESFLRRVKEIGVKPFTSTVFSAHQMGSCRMSATVSDGPVRPTGETYECTNLFVADASLFPTALGINPMVTIEAMSRMVARRVVARHGEIRSQKR